MANSINVRIPNTIIGLGVISNIGDVAKKFAPSRVLIVTDAGIVKAGIIDRIKPPLEKAGCKFDIFDGCEVEPSISCIEKLSQKIKTGKYDLLIGVGGGSAMDATKVASIIAANDGISTYDLLDFKAAEKTIAKILVPTTSGTGSEWSASAVVADDKEGMVTKVIRTPQNLANAVILDPELTINLPQRITADTGMDALTHAIEAYVSAKANIVSDMFAENAIKLISENLRPAYTKGSKNIEARYNMSIAASLAMVAVTMSSAGLVHFMNEPLGKKAHISHGTACALLLPDIMEYNLIANPAKFARVAEFMGENINGLSVFDAATKSVEAVRRLIKDLGMPQKLSEIRGIGLTEADIPGMVEEVHKKLGAIINEMKPRYDNPEKTKRLYAKIF